MGRLPIEQTPVKKRMFKSKCDAYCHNRQVPRIHVRIYVCDAMYVKGEIMQLQPHRKSSVSAAFLACIAGVLAFARAFSCGLRSRPCQKRRKALIMEERLKQLQKEQQQTAP